MEKYFPLHFKQIKKLHKLDNQTKIEVSSENTQNNETINNENRSKKMAVVKRGNKN